MNSGHVWCIPIAVLSSSTPGACGESLPCEVYEGPEWESSRSVLGVPFLCKKLSIESH